MAVHIWNVKKIGKATVKNGIMLYKFAISKGLDFNGACAFSGYLMEIARMGGYVNTFGHWNVNGFQALDYAWNPVENSGHKYAKGKNGDNYRLAGRRIVDQYLKDVASNHLIFRELLNSLVAGEDCSFALHDWLLENGYPEKAELFEFTKLPTSVNV